MMLNDMKILIEVVVQKLYKYAYNNYNDLSSFAIITEETYSTFGIAVNVNDYFNDLLEHKISDEDYWNPAEWVEETLECVYQPDEIVKIWNILDRVDKQIKDDYFLDFCKQALSLIRTDSNKKTCLFVHLTDYSYHENLYEIVKYLNGDKMASSYQSYYLE